MTGREDLRHPVPRSHLYTSRPFLRVRPNPGDERPEWSETREVGREGRRSEEFRTGTEGPVPSRGPRQLNCHLRFEETKEGHLLGREPVALCPYKQLTSLVLRLRFPH